MPAPPAYASKIPLDQQTSTIRAEFGRQVAERLAKARGARRLEARNAEIYCHSDFLTAQECQWLIRLIDAGCGPSPEYKVAGYDEYRTSSTCDFDRAQRVVATVERKIVQLLGLPAKNGEALQGQRYQTGQHFRVHPDYFYIDQPYWQEVEPHGGQRTWTAMVYLNQPERGGATRFPYAEVEVAPQAGLLLAWNNMAADGAPNPWTFHEGAGVEAGTKYIVTKWFRERPWV